MADWQTLTTVTYSDLNNSISSLTVKVQYDKDSTNPVRTKIRFVGTKGGSSTSDGVYILYNANNNPETVGRKYLELKAPDKNWHASGSITITKAYNAEKFAVQDFWICNIGKGSADLEKGTVAYADGTKSFYDHFKENGGRYGFVSRHSGTSITGYEATAGTVSKPTIRDLGTNKFRLSGKVTAGTLNAFDSAKIYYTTNNTTPTASSSYKEIESTGDYSFDISLPTNSTAASHQVNAKIICDFTYNTNVTSSATEVKVLRHTNGGTPSITAITDNNNNTFTVTGAVGADGINNARSSTTLYITANGKDPSSDGTTASITVGTNGSFTTGELKIPSRSTDGATTIKAYVVSTFPWGSSEAKKTKSARKDDGSVYFHSDIGSPSITITDNLDNTFTISGVAAANGVNNTAATTYAWGYTNNYGTNGTVANRALTISGTADTRTVYAKAEASPSWSVDSVKQKTTSLAIKQYIKPSEPGKPNISYNKNRLTIKENWRYAWKASTATNSNSPVIGYRIRLYKNNVPIAIKNSSGTILSNSPNNSDPYWDSESTSNYILIDPLIHEFKPGDTVKLGLHAYTKDGKSNKIFSNSSAQIYSDVSTVQNAGIVRVNIGGTWKEGQVWANVGGTWKEADIVRANIGGTWEESE